MKLADKIVEKRTQRMFFPPVILSDGSTVYRVRQVNGSIYASLPEDAEMTESQWQEFCRLTGPSNA